MRRFTGLCILFMSCIIRLQAGDTIVVAKDGSADFKSIQGAINSLPDDATTDRVIFVKNGLYEEKIYLRKNHIVIVGQDRAGVVIKQAIARDEWRCLHNDDWGVATINIEGNDITLKNLSIVNSFGFDWVQDKIIDCPKDTANREKKIMKYGHQMALRTFRCTRLKVINCHLRAYGGDTVSPWDVQSGMFYFRDCIMEGGVDFYCPRGWAYAENCRFISHGGTAAIWHDGSVHQDSKTVLKNCSFSGFDGFNLGRYHRDAQFYLIDCSFAANMSDRDIYLVPTGNDIRWGRRIYYFNCHREGGNDFIWYANNLQTAPGSPDYTTITASWVFNGRWQPE